MKKHLASIFLALVMCFGLCIPALAAGPDADQLQVMLEDENRFTKVIVLEEPVIVDGEIIGTHSVCQYFPNGPQPRVANTCYVTDEYLTRDSTPYYVRLTGLFRFDGSSVSCIDTSVTHDVPGYKEKSLNISGNGTRKSTVKLSFSFESLLGPSAHTLNVWCDKDGHTS